MPALKKTLANATWTWWQSIKSDLSTKATLPPSSTKRSDRGFTLLELLVVLVIIGLLVSYVGPRYFDQVGKSEVKVARSQLDAFEKALAAYRLDVGHYPSTQNGLQALNERPQGEARWAGPYLSKAVPLDPWGHAYSFRLPGEAGHEFELSSFGKDGQSGGTGLDADLSIWDAAR